MKNIMAIFLGFFITLSLFLGGYIVYSNINDEKVEEEKPNTEENVNKNEGVKNVIVVPGIEFTDSYYGKIKVTIPQIIGGGSNSITLNKQIASEVLKSTYSYVNYLANDDFSGYGKDGATVVYDTIIKNDIVAIYIESKTIDTGVGYPGSGDGVSRFNYFYNIKHDEEMSLDEALPMLGYTNDDLKKFNVNSFKELTTKGYTNFIIKNGVGTIDFTDCTNGCV